MKILEKEITEERLDEFEKQIDDKVWIYEALGSLDRCMTDIEGSSKDGSGALHIACIHGYLDTFYYLLFIFIVREKIGERKLAKGDTSFQKFKSLRETLNYGNKHDMIPLLVAVKYDNYEVFRVLF